MFILVSGIICFPAKTPSVKIFRKTSYLPKVSYSIITVIKYPIIGNCKQKIISEIIRKNISFLPKIGYILRARQFQETGR
jgi:surface polysaccharide O-acyltransferase-like enzyme